MRHQSLLLFLILFGCKTNNVNQSDIKPNIKVIGTVTSGFELFIFTPVEIGDVHPLNDNVSWISNKSSKSEDWDILFSMHDKLMQEPELSGFEICVSGIATIKSTKKDTQPDFGYYKLESLGVPCAGASGQAVVNQVRFAVSAMRRPSLTHAAELK